MKKGKKKKKEIAQSCLNFISEEGVCLNLNKNSVPAWCLLSYDDDCPGEVKAMLGWRDMSTKGSFMTSAQGIDFSVTKLPYTRIVLATCACTDGSVMRAIC